METMAFVLSGILLVPYLGWGIITLRLRYRYHEDLPLWLEGLTLAGLLLFYVFEFALLATWLGDTPLTFVFAVLGLVVSGSALYGHVAVSFVSQLLVDFISPPDRDFAQEPRYGPAETLEHQGDFEGAVREYFVIARIFPNLPTPALRIADNLLKLEKPAQAAEWFERGLRNMEAPDKALMVANRLVEIYERQLDQPEKAEAVLNRYLSQFPESPYTDMVLRRTQTLRDHAAATDSWL